MFGTEKTLPLRSHEAGLIEEFMGSLGQKTLVETNLAAAKLALKHNLSIQASRELERLIRTKFAAK